MAGRFARLNASTLFDARYQSKPADLQGKEIPQFSNYLYMGGVKPSLLGIQNHGDVLQNLAHRVDTMKRFDNVINGGGDRIMSQISMGEDRKPILIPHLNAAGEMVYPNAQGEVRYVSKGHLDLLKEVYESIEDRIDLVMEYCIISDEVARLTLGISTADWKTLTTKFDATKPAELKVLTDVNKELADISEEMAGVNCSIRYIQSLPANSLSQTASLSRLRYIVRAYLKNVNFTTLVSSQEMKGDIGAGKLNENTMPAPPPAGP